MARMEWLRSFGGRVFSVYPGEWSRLLLLYCFAFALNTSVVWGQATSDALFLQQMGAQLLPAMFVGDALITVIAVLAYSSFVDRIPNLQLMVIICLLGGVMLALVRVGLALGLAAVYPLLFLLDRMLRAMITIHSWTYIADFYDTRMAKRHFPLIGSGSRTSGILAGALLFPLSMLLGANNLVLAWLVVLLLCAALAWLTPRIVPPVHRLGPGPTARTSVLATLAEGASLVASSRFLRLMAASAVVGTALLYLLEYQSQVIIAASFDNAEVQATFYGLLGAVADAITLPIQMLLLARLVTRFGVGNANLIFPGLTAISYSLLVVWPALPSAAVARVDRTALRSSFRTPIDGMLYNAVAPSIKGRARAFINGLLVPLGALGAGLLLLLVAWVPPLAVVVVPLGLIMALLSVVAAWRLRAAYGRALVDLLETDDLASLRPQPDELGLTDPTTLSLLRMRLDASPDDETTIFLAELLYDLQGPLALPQLRDLALQRGPQVRAGIIVLLGDSGPAEPVVRRLCIESLRDEHAPVRLAALRALIDAPAVARDPEVLEALLALLGAPDTTPQVQALSLPPLIASNRPVYRDPAQLMLAAWLDADPGSARREAGLRVLAKTHDPRLLTLLGPSLVDPAPAARQEAIAYLSELLAHSPAPLIQQQVVALLGKLLADPDERVRRDAVTALGVIDTAAAGEALRAALSDPSFQVRRQACAQLGRAALAELGPGLDSPDALLVESATFLLAVELPRARRLVPVLVEQLVHAAYGLSLQRLSLLALEAPAVRLLDTRLREQTDLLLERVFWLLSAPRREEGVWTVLRVLRRGESAGRENALEALEALSAPHLARLIAPLLADTPLPELARIGREQLGLEATTPWQFMLRAWEGASADAAAGFSDQLAQVYRDPWLIALAFYTWALAARHRAMHAAASCCDLPAGALQPLAAACLQHPVPLVREAARLLRPELATPTDAIAGEAQMLTTIERLIFLKQVPFFHAMTIEQLYVLADISEEMPVEAGQTVLSEGASVDALYVVISGRIALQRRQQRRQDSITRLATLQARDYFAEMSIFDNEPLSADAVALAPSRLLLVRQAPLLALIKRYPELGLALLRVLSQRLRQVDNRFAEKLKSRPRQLVDLYDTLDSA